MSTKAGRQASAQKQKQKQTQNQNKNRQISQQARPQSQAPKAPSLTPAEQQALRESRINKQAEARAAAQRRRRMKTLRRNAIIAAAVLVLVGLIAVFYIREATKPGQSVPAMAVRNHIPANTTSPVAYNTDPPTNGPHVDSLPEFKVYTEPITKELAVHGLEDAAVIINYKPDTDKATVDKLASIATSYIQLGGGRSHVIMAPYPNLSNSIVLTAWRRIDRLDVLDEARIRRFIDEYVGIDHHEGTEGKRLP
ncbi:MAG TPA: DUF3105 domain-containing protein [Chloroflexia bacterium]|nr:DUF3105 domain-containing protein [Chloroflexia bacterium]